jgi:hypothetical protein
VADNVIELNGKRYDAVSGAYLGTVQPAAATKMPVHKAPAAKGKGKAIDGFIRQTIGVQHAPAKPAAVRKVSDITPTKPATHKAAPTPHPVTAKPALARRATPKAIAKPAAAVHAKAVANKVTRPAKPKPAPHTIGTIKRQPTDGTQAMAVRKASSARAHKPEHSQTLMRRIVQKPHTTIKPAIKPQAPAETLPALLSNFFKPSALQVDPARLARAKRIAKHAGIRHFMPVIPDHTPAAVAVTPQVTPAAVPVIAVQAAPPREHRPKTHPDIFEAAIAKADSHKQPRHALHHKHRRLANTLAVVGAVMVIASFVAYLNLPNIQVHIASVQAGFKADLPSYKPTGYALNGGVRRTGNTVSMTFRSGENNFTITQQPSDWNSQTLQENTLALAGDDHKTIEAGGRMVFVYDGSNAVWVNGGVRYDLNTNAPLSTEDISRLASSL